MADASKIMSVNTTNINKLLGIGIANANKFMLNTLSIIYTPPLGYAVNFIFSVDTYTPPNGDAVNIIL